jgi:hypothetical protein
MIGQFIHDQDNRDAEATREKNKMRVEMANMRKRLWAYRKDASGESNDSYKKMLERADEQCRYYLSSEGEGEDDKKAKTTRRRRRQRRRMPPLRKPPSLQPAEAPGAAREKRRLKEKVFCRQCRRNRKLITLALSVLIAKEMTPTSPP